ncbi:MAG TPA: hypothetical protein VIK33_18870, partial [Anaerolineae bacterium]
MSKRYILGLAIACLLIILVDSVARIAVTASVRLSDERITVDGVTEVQSSSPLVVDRMAITAAVMHENFESTWPAPGWMLIDDSSSDGGEYKWGKRSCHPRAGNFGGWSVGGGAQGSSRLCSATYPNNIRTWAIYGPFDLSQATSASLTFHVWGRSESVTGCPYDYLFAGSSADGVNLSGSKYCGDWTNGDAGNGYYSRTLDLSSRLGQSRVWVAFLFVSNSSVTHAGFTIDDVALNTNSAPAPSPTPTVKSNIYLSFIAKQSTPTPMPIRFAGTTDQNRVVDFDVDPNLSAVNQFRIGFKVVCSGVTTEGTLRVSRPGGWPISDRRFEIQAVASVGVNDVFTGEFDPTFSSVEGTWLKWLVVNDQPRCSNSGTW